jgi:hypothetical protein
MLSLRGCPSYLSFYTFFELRRNDLLSSSFVLSGSGTTQASGKVARCRDAVSAYYSRDTDRWPPINIVVTSGKCSPRDEQMPTNTQFVGKPYQTADVLMAFRAFD